MPPTEYPTLEESVERATAEIARALRAAGDELERQVAELNTELELAQEQIAELGVRVERLGVLVGEDQALGSRGVAVPAEALLGPVPEVVERLRPYFAGRDVRRPRNHALRCDCDQCEEARWAGAS